MVGNGDAVTFSWTTRYARQCVIQPGVGAVDLSGSVPFTPTETTVYTLTATGPGGSATDSLTVTVVPKPQIVLGADPGTFAPGEPAVLTWNVLDADFCSLAPDIGSVDLSGSLTVTPSATTTYTLTATGPGGTASQTVTVSVDSPISIQILYPTDGASLDRPDTLVHGTFANGSGRETGIAVNGKVAMVYGNQFALNHVPLQEGENTIAVTATDVNGAWQEESISVFAALPEHHIDLAAAIESGSSPLEANLRIAGTFGIVESAISYTGPGVVEFLESGEDSYRVRLIEEGVYYLTAEAVRETVTYTDTIVIVVVDAAEIDALLQRKWADMKTKLGDGDIAGALNHFSEGTRPMFEYNFNLLSAHMNEIIAGMQSIALVKIQEGRAEYNLVGEQAGHVFSFYLLFQKTADGTWRIVNF